VSCGPNFRRQEAALERTEIRSATSQRLVRLMTQYAELTLGSPLSDT
jgi:hypothetical protein